MWFDLERSKKNNAPIWWQLIGFAKCQAICQNGLVG
jgi:hypothetical protein